MLRGAEANPKEFLRENKISGETQAFGPGNIRLRACFSASRTASEGGVELGDEGKNRVDEGVVNVGSELGSPRSSTPPGDSLSKLRDGG